MSDLNPRWGPEPPKTNKKLTKKIRFWHAAASLICLIFSIKHLVAVPLGVLMPTSSDDICPVTVVTADLRPLADLLWSTTYAIAYAFLQMLAAALHLHHDGTSCRKTLLPWLQSKWRSVKAWCKRYLNRRAKCLSRRWKV